MASLGEQIETRVNGLNVLRLVFAVLVIVSHSWPISGDSREPAIGDIKLGTLAVAGFFVISGYLISQSRDRSGLLDYLWKRARRIYPGYWICLIVTAAVFAPIAAVLDGGWSTRSALTYVVNNWFMVRDQGRIGTTLESSPFPSVWNGSLWTLKHEVLSYILIGLLFAVRPLRASTGAAGSVFVAATAASLYTRGLEGQVLLSNFCLLFAFFASGYLLYTIRYRVPVRADVACAATVAFFVAAHFDVARVFGGLPMAYLCLFIGLRMPQALKRVGQVNDISYGTYLYAFPVQQLLSLAGVGHGHPMVLAVAATACTIPVAWISWRLVERRLLRARAPWARRRAPIEPSRLSVS